MLSKTVITRQRVPRKNAQAGFGILEMMVALAITIGLTGVLFYFLKQGQESYEVEGARSDLNQNFRAALDLITRDIQSAGAGIPSFLGPIVGKDGGTGPDQIMLAYGDPNFVPVTVNSTVTNATSSISFPTPGSTFVAGNNYILYTPRIGTAVNADDSDRSEFSVFTLDSVTTAAGVTTLLPKTSGLTLDPDSAYTDSLAFPSDSTLSVTGLQQLIEYRIDTTNKTLQRRSRVGVQANNSSSNTWVDVARGITDLQIRYNIETADTSTNPPTFTPATVDQILHTSTNNGALIRSIQLTLTAQTQMGVTDGRDRQGQRKISQTLIITPRNLSLPGFVPNR